MPLLTKTGMTAAQLEAIGSALIQSQGLVLITGPTGSGKTNTLYAAIQQVSEEAGFGIVRSLVGHGVGRSYHEEPQIPNFGRPGRGPVLSEGMTLAIEPMITAGRPEVHVHDDGWTISTADGSLAAHFEHTVAVTEAGPRILTTSAVPLLR